MSTGEQSEATDESQGDGRPLRWLIAGAALGVLLAAVGLLRDASGPAGTDRFGPDVAARVNEAVILRSSHERLVAGLESDTQSVADAATRERVLDRMIDEELLVQRGLELGLAQTDRRIRGDLTAAVIRAVVVEAEERMPTRDELTEFFDEERGFFTLPGRLRVEQIFFRVRDSGEQEAAAARAATALAALRNGTEFAAVREAHGDGVVSPVPNALLPAAKLREYVGPTAAQAAAGLDVGAVSEAIRSGMGFHILRVTEREPARTPPFDDLEPQVRAEWRRRAGDEALRAYLDELRERADVVIAEP